MDENDNLLIEKLEIVSDEISIFPDGVLEEILMDFF